MSRWGLPASSLLVLGLAWLAGSACSRSGLGDGGRFGPLALVGEGAVDFGATGVGFTSTRLVTLNAVVPIDGVTPSVAPPFTFTGGAFPGTRGTCQPAFSGACVLDLVFAPARNGAFEELLVLRYVSGGSGYQLPITMRGMGSEVGTIADAGRSSIVANSPVTADGTDVSTIAVTLRDAADLPVPGQSVGLAVSGTGNLLTPCAQTDGAGRSTCELRSTVAEDKIVNTTTPVVLAGVTVSFIDRAVASIVFTRQPVVGTAGVLTTMPEVTLYDAAGAPVVDVSGAVTLSVVGDGGLAGEVRRDAVDGVVDFSGAGLRLERYGSVRLRARAANGVTGDSDVLVVAPIGLTKSSLRSGPVRGRGHVNGARAQARVHAPTYAVTNGNDVFFTESDVCTVRRYNLVTGAVATLAGAPYQCDDIVEAQAGNARFMRPQGLALSSNSLFVADSAAHVIMHIDITTGQSTLWAGAVDESGTANGPRLSARFSDPRGLATDGSYLYVGSCGDCTLRRIALGSGDAVNFAGGVCGVENGTGGSAQFGCITDIEPVPSGLWVTHDGRHRRVDTSNAAVTTTAVNVFGTSNLAYVAASNSMFYNGYDGIFSYDITTSNSTQPSIAGGDNNRYVDADLASSRFYDPTDLVAVDGGVLILDANNSALRMASITNNAVTTLVGLSGNGLDQVDGVAEQARYREPRGLAADGAALYVGEQRRIVRYDPATGLAQRWAGDPQDDAGVVDGPRADARIAELRAMTTDGTRIYFTDFRQVRALGEDEVVTTIAGAGAQGVRDGVGTGARFLRPDDLTHHQGMLYVEDAGTIRRIDVRTGAVTTVFGASERYGCEDTGGAEPGRIDNVGGMVVAGNTLYMVDCFKLRAIDLTTFAITSLTGFHGCELIDGEGQAAGVGCAASDITSDGRYLYVSSSETGTIQRIELFDGIPSVTVWAGNALDRRELDGVVASMRLVEPRAMYFGFGRLWVANAFNVRAID